MDQTATNLIQKLSSLADPQKAIFSQRFFKTQKGEYAEGDKFIGITVPDIRAVTKSFQSISLSELQKVITNEVHEYRLASLIILVDKFQKRKEEHERKQLIDFYLKYLDQVNNWDLVDISAEILGEFLINKDRKLLYKLAHTKKLWYQRVAIVATFHYIKHYQFTDTIKLAEIFLTHKHDLIHKATGWMLREIGKRDMAVLTEFLDKNCIDMPRTMLRYTIERFPEPTRQKYLKCRKKEEKIT